MKNFREWLNESKLEDALLSASEIAKIPDMKELLNDVEEGKYPHIQIVKTAGATSYIGASLNDGFPVGKVFHTDSPIEALIATIINDIGSKDLERIRETLKEQHLLLQYSVFPGARKPTAYDLAMRFNVRYQDFSDNSISFYTSTPLKISY